MFRTILKVLGTLVLLGAVYVGAVIGLGVRQERYECNGAVSSGGTSYDTKLYLRLELYRWFLVYADNDGNALAELPNTGLIYYDRLEVTSVETVLISNSILSGTLYQMSGNLSLLISTDHLFTGTCHPSTR